MVYALHRVTIPKCRLACLTKAPTHSEPPRPTVSTCLRKPPQHRDELFEHELFKEVIQLVVASDEKRPTPKIARQPRRSFEGAA
jgi:hypothetical protein